MPPPPDQVVEIDRIQRDRAIDVAGRLRRR
jgi:hypothetical protein